MNINHLSINELIELYGKILKKLKEEGVIRTRNLVGELGEYVAIDYYCKTRGLPKLQPAPPSTKNIDAISVNGERLYLSIENWFFPKLVEFTYFFKHKNFLP